MSEVLNLTGIRKMTIRQCASLALVIAGALSALPAKGQDKAPELPKGYREVSPDKAKALRELCQATAETGLFSGAVLVADKGEVIYKEAFGLANRGFESPSLRHFF